MAYGKLNEQGQLISANTQLDDSFQELSLFEIKDEDGNRTGEYYDFYNQDLTPDTEKIQALAVLKMIADGEKLVEGHVQLEVLKYNEANGVRFTNVDSCAKYISIESYPHVDFCKAIVEFNALCWTAARDAQADGSVDLDTTEDEFKAMLPVYTVEGE